MVLTAVRGALGFLTRLPVGRDEGAWEAFRTTPAAFPLAGYLIGLALVVPLALPLPPATAALAFVIWLYVVTGINHLDGLADLGDAASVHGGAAERREVMTDTAVGVGAVAAVGTVLLGVGLAGFSLATAPVEFLGVVVAAEVGAKLAMALLACFGTAAHEGLGSAFAGGLDRRSSILPVVVALPAAAATGPHPAAAIALGGAIVPTAGVFWWARQRLDGMSGDVLGATNELARLVALHAGVLAWTLW